LFSDSEIFPDTNIKKKKDYAEDKIIIEEKESSQQPMSNNKAMKSLLNIDASPISKTPSVSRFSQTIIVNDDEDDIHVSPIPLPNTKAKKGTKYTKAKNDIIPSKESNNNIQFTYTNSNSQKTNNNVEKVNPKGKEKSNNIKATKEAKPDPKNNVENNKKDEPNNESNVSDKSSFIEKKNQPVKIDNKSTKENKKEDNKEAKNGDKKDGKNKQSSSEINKENANKGKAQKDEIPEANKNKKEILKSSDQNKKPEPTKKDKKKVDKKKQSPEESQQSSAFRQEAYGEDNEDKTIEKIKLPKKTDTKKNEKTEKETYSDEEVEYDADIFNHVLNESLFPTPDKQPTTIKRKHKEIEDKESDKESSVEKPATKRKKQLTENEYIKKAYHLKDLVKTVEVELPDVNGETFGHGRYPKRHRIPTLNKELGERIRYVKDYESGAWVAETVLKANPHALMRAFEVAPSKKRKLRKGLNKVNDDEDELEEEVIQEDIEDGKILTIPPKKQKKPHMNYGCILKCEILRPSNKFSINIEDEELKNLKKGETFTINPYKEFNFVNYGTDDLKIKFSIEKPKKKK
jgi:hypothetical protein